MPQFTIKRLISVIAVIGVVLALLRHLPLSTFAAMYSLCVFGLGWSIGRLRPKLASWEFIGSAICLKVSLFAAFACLPIFHKSALLFSSIAFIPIVPGFGLTWITAHDRWAARVRATLVVAVAVSVIASMLATHWPLKLAFYLSSPALNRLADRVESGEAMTKPEWAGLYLIYSVRAFNATGDLILRANATRGMMAGFIRRSGAAKGARREALYYGTAWDERWNYHDSW
jgi:hypothetical protein